MSPARGSVAASQRRASRLAAQNEAATAPSSRPDVAEPVAKPAAAAETGASGLERAPLNVTPVATPPHPSGPRAGYDPTVIVLSDTVNLTVPAEPREVGEALACAYRDGVQWPVGTDAGTVAGVLWEAWSDGFGALAAETWAESDGAALQQLFGQVGDGYRRELWLWVAGERQWAEVASGFAGRVARRLAISSV